MWFKRCRHEWHKVGEKKRLGFAHIIYTDIHTYCPKCDKYDTVDLYDWPIIKAAQGVLRAYELNQKQGG